MSDFIEELKRRRVFRAVALYVVGALGVLQAADLILPSYDAPPGTMRALVTISLIGLPIAAILGWMFDVRPRENVPAAETRLPRAVLVAALVGTAAVIGVGLWFGFTRGAGIESDGETIADRSIAVLPFDNLSGPDSEYLSDGITEDILNSLAGIQDLRVISRTSVMQYKGDNRPALPEIAAKLNVGHILEGSVQRAGNQLRITVQLIRARDDAHLWSEQFDRSADSVFAVQSEIARAVANRLQATLSGDEERRLARPATEDPAAHSLFIRGREAYYGFYDAGRIEEAINFLRQAVGRDPEFALAHAYLSRAMTIHSRNAGVEWLDSARAVAQHAIELRPDEPDGYSALGESLREAGRYEAALVEYRRALEIDPNHAVTIAEIGETHSWNGLGNLDESIRFTVRAIELDPVQPWIHSMGASTYIRLGDLETALRWIERLDRSMPGNAYSAPTRLVLAVARGDRAAYDSLAPIADSAVARTRAAALLAHVSALLHFGDFDAARATAEEWLTEADGPPRSAIIAAIGRFDRARALPWADSLEARLHARTARGDRRSDIPHALARAALVRGDHAGAIEHLEEWSRRGGPAVYVIRSREWDALRNDDRFQALERSIVARADSVRANLARDGL